MAMIKLLEYTFDNTIEADCLPTFTDVGTTEVIDSVSGNITTRIINVEESALPSAISFNGKTALLTLEYMNTDNLNTMYRMFYNCKYLKSVNSTNFRTGKVTSMQQAFSGCIELASIDTSKWTTNNVTTLYYTFYNCSSLTTLDLTNWDTSKVTDMRFAFQNCKALTSLNLSNWNTSKVTNIQGMFSGCASLISLDVSNFDTGKVLYASNLFNGCSKLTKLDVSNFNTSTMIQLDSMFYDCLSLTSLNVSNFNLPSATTVYKIFYNCASLTSLDLSSWNVNDVQNIGYMFYNCSSLASLDISNFDMTNVTNTTNIFANCNQLTNIGLLYSPASTINKITPLLPTSTSKNIYYLDAIPSELTPVNNVNFVEYKSNTISTNNVVLRSLPNGVCDTLDLMTGEYVQRIGEIVLDGSEDWVGNTNFPQTDTHLLMQITLDDTVENSNGNNMVCDKMQATSYAGFNNKEFDFVCVGKSGGIPNLFAKLSKDKLVSFDKNGFNNYFSQNPITVQYELATPITTTIDLKQHLFAYKDGYVVLTSSSEEISLTPTIEYSLIANRLGQIQSNQKLVEKQQTQIDELESMVITNLVNTQYQQALNEIKLGVK